MYGWGYPLLTFVYPGFDFWLMLWSGGLVNRLAEFLWGSGLGFGSNDEGTCKVQQVDGERPTGNTSKLARPYC